jgi:hypothetical protein
MDNKVKVPINEKLAAKLVEENEGNLTGFMTEIRTVFKTPDGEPIFELHKQVKNEQEYISYFAYFTKYGQEN